MTSGSLIQKVISLNRSLNEDTATDFVYNFNESYASNFSDLSIENWISNQTKEDDQIICTHFSKAPSHAWSEVLEGILSVVVGVFGLLGNIIAIFILKKDEFKETFHKLLICLCAFDSLFLICALFIYAFRAHRLYLINSDVVHYLFIIFYPSGNISLYGSIYTTLAISFERYRGITSPLRSRTEPKRKLIKYLFPVLLLSIGFNLPKIFETTIGGSQNTWLSRNIAYTHYYKVWSDLILTTIIPLIVLLFCNGSIVLTIRRSRSMQNCSSSSNSRLKQEFALSMVLIGIVLVFISCHAFRFFLAFYRVSVTERTITCLVQQGLNAKQPEWLYAITAISHFMLIVSSSVNFLVYCAFGTRFRKAIRLDTLINFLSKLCNKNSSHDPFESIDTNRCGETRLSNPKSEENQEEEETILEMVHIGEGNRKSRKSFKTLLCIKSNKSNRLRKYSWKSRTKRISFLTYHSNTVEITEI